MQIHQCFRKDKDFRDTVSRVWGLTFKSSRPSLNVGEVVGRSRDATKEVAREKGRVVVPLVGIDGVAGEGPTPHATRERSFGRRDGIVGR